MAWDIQNGFVRKNHIAVKIAFIGRIMKVKMRVFALASIVEIRLSALIPTL